MPTASEVEQLYRTDQMIDRTMLGKAAAILAADPILNRQPDYWLYLFNTAPIEFERRRPPNNPRIKIKACPIGEPYVCAAKIPNIVWDKWFSAETGQPSTSPLAGERWATDLINPANLSNDMWANIPNNEFSQMHGGGDDLSRRGVFWSRNEVPTREELEKSRQLKERHYRQTIQEAELLARKGKMDEIGPEAHLAADYMSARYPGTTTTSWHFISEPETRCPNCGEPIKAGAAFHQSSLGACIIDWQRAVTAGVKTKADVPEQHRWWDELPDEPELVETGEIRRGRPRKDSI